MTGNFVHDKYDQRRAKTGIYGLLLKYQKYKYMSLTITLKSGRFDLAI